MNRLAFAEWLQDPDFSDGYYRVDDSPSLWEEPKSYNLMNLLILFVLFIGGIILWLIVQRQKG
jgi:hypothetical protein